MWRANDSASARVMVVRPECGKGIVVDPDYAEAHFNLALVYLDRRPPALQLAKRHYLRAKQLGSPPDRLVEEHLRITGICLWTACKERHWETPHQGL